MENTFIYIHEWSTIMWGQRNRRRYTSEIESADECCWGRNKNDWLQEIERWATVREFIKKKTDAIKLEEQREPFWSSTRQMKPLSDGCGKLQVCSCSAWTHGEKPHYTEPLKVRDFRTRLGGAIFEVLSNKTWGYLEMRELHWMWGDTMQARGGGEQPAHPLGCTHAAPQDRKGP